jgi:hypothetical protein
MRHSEERIEILFQVFHKKMTSFWVDDIMIFRCFLTFNPFIKEILRYKYSKMSGQIFVQMLIDLFHIIFLYR